MPVHDWSRVEAGNFHDFHHALIEQIKRDLNNGLLPPDYYALAEQFAAGVSPDVQRLPVPQPPDDPAAANGPANGGGLLVARPGIRSTAETKREAYRSKNHLVAIRHVSGDRVGALVDVISPGNKSSRQALDSFVQKVAEFLDRKIHHLIIDLIPPGRYDHSGLHGAIWDYIDGCPYEPPAGKPLTVAAYESSAVTRAHVVPIAVGDELPKMPPFLEPEDCVEVPLDISYRAA